MSEIIQSCASFGVFLCLGTYFLGLHLNKRLKSPLTNPLLLATVGCIAVLLLCGIDYEVFKASAQPLSYLLTPATVSLAIPLYRQLDKLKTHYKAILVGVFSGVLASGLSIFAMSALFGLSHTDYVTLLPKSVTTAIGTASHALGTSKAIEIGEVEGAMSGLSIAVAGLMTVVLAPLFAMLL